MWTRRDEALIKTILIERDPGYIDKIGGGYHYKQVPSKMSRFYMRETVAYLLSPDNNIPRDLRILDYGCGVGTFMAYLGKHGFINIEGQDIKLREIDTARAVMKEFGFDFPLKLVKPTDIYLPFGSYDLIIMGDFIYMKSLELQEIMRNVARSLNPDGLFSFDLFASQPNPRDDRIYYSRDQVIKMACPLFDVISTLTKHLGLKGPVRTFYMLRLRKQ